jgi:hypothetical protein
MIVKLGGSLLEKRSAMFSDDERYRYTLKITWKPENAAWPTLVCVALNPSHADEMRNDLTVGKLCKMAEARRYGGLLMLNLFAYRSPDPRALYEVEDPIGPVNTDDNLCAHIQKHGGRALAAWGSGGLMLNRAESFLKACKAEGIKLQCFRMNPDGTPIHPLARGKNHVPLSTLLIDYTF